MALSIGYIKVGHPVRLVEIFRFSALQQTAAFLGLLITLIIGAIAVFEGASALLALPVAGFRIFINVFAIVDIVSGLVLFVSHPFGALLRTVLAIT